MTMSMWCCFLGSSYGQCHGQSTTDADFRGTSPYDNSVCGGWGVLYGRGEKASDEQGLDTHSKCLCVIIHPQREVLHFHPQMNFFLCSIWNQVKRLLNLIGWKIQSFCFWWQTGGTVYFILWVSGHFICEWLWESLWNWFIAQQSCEISADYFPLTTGHNMFIDPCLLSPSISPSATQFLTAAWARRGRTL